MENEFGKEIVSEFLADRRVVKKWFFVEVSFMKPTLLTDPMN